jgi:hypothetical protein
VKCVNGLCCKRKCFRQSCERGTRYSKSNRTRCWKSNLYIYIYVCVCVWVSEWVSVGRVAQSVYGLATSWTVRGSNPDGGEIFRTHSDRSRCPPSRLYNGYRVIPGDKAAGAWCWPPTPSSAEVTKGYTSIHPLGQFRPVTGVLYLIYNAIFIALMYIFSPTCYTV